MGLYDTELRTYKHQALVAAKDLLYDEETISKIKAAKTENEIRQIMAEGRKRRFGEF